MRDVNRCSKRYHDETRNQNNKDTMKFITHVLLTMNLHHQWENETRKRGIVLIDSTVYGS